MKKIKIKILLEKWKNTEKDKLSFSEKINKLIN